MLLYYNLCLLDLYMRALSYHFIFFEYELEHKNNES